jgi:hypothetical protein
LMYFSVYRALRAGEMEKRFVRDKEMRPLLFRTSPLPLTAAA